MPTHCSERKTQAARILAKLIEAHGEWVPLPTLLDLRIAQLNTRIHELRGIGFQIENKQETTESGARYSWYRLVAGPAANTPELDTAKPEAPKPKPVEPEHRITADRGGDWFEQQTGKPRPVEPQPDLPLFRQVTHG